MNTEESFCDSTHQDLIQIAERELSAFLRAVTELFGPEQAKVSTEDWLEEAALMDGPPGSTNRDWRAVTIAASARPANRLADARPCRSGRRIGERFVGSSRQGFSARRTG